MQKPHCFPLELRSIADALWASPLPCLGRRRAASASVRPDRDGGFASHRRALRLRMGVALLALLAAVLCRATALAEAAGEGADEWTVMLYFCGSDLESRYSYASGNLEELAIVDYPDNLLPTVAEMYGVDIGQVEEPGRVNILIETGGAKEWHAQKAGMDIDAGALQRWRYDYYPYGGLGRNGPFDGYTLVETLPLKSMADPETLTDFIQWGVKT